MRKHITKAERARVEKQIQEGEDGYPNKKAAPPTVEAPAFAQAEKARVEEALRETLELPILAIVECPKCGARSNVYDLDNFADKKIFIKLHACGSAHFAQAYRASAQNIKKMGH